jgi:hypothetical protein
MKKIRCIFEISEIFITIICKLKHKKEDNEMKKYRTALYVLILILMFTACGSDGENKSTAGTDDEKSLVSQETENTVKYEETESSIKIEETESTAIEETEKLQSAFEEITVIDNEECSLKITGIDPDNLWGYTLKVNLENKSADKTYMFDVESAAINGVQCDPFFAAEVTAGKKANNEINFSDDTLEEYDIGEYTDIELTFRVFDTDDWLADDVANETVHIYPYGEENATTYVREAQPTDVVLVDNDDITVIVTGYDPDDLWGYAVNLYLVNKTDTSIMFSADDVSVNGYMADPYYASLVSPQKCAFASMSWSSSTFEENGISEVEEIEMLFSAYDYDSWDSENYFEEVVTLNP